MKHFVLVHGACHGAWCWYKVESLLKSAGHKVTVLDLAGSGIHPKQVNGVKSFSDYVEPLMEFMESPSLMEEKVVLVGHSYGGLCISDAMEKFPDRVSVAVYATAFMPGPDLRESLLQESNRRQDSYMDTQFTFDQGESNPPTSFLWGRNIMASQFYQLSPPEFCLAVSPSPFSLQPNPGSEALSVSTRRVRRRLVVLSSLLLRKAPLLRKLRRTPPSTAPHRYQREQN